MAETTTSGSDGPIAGTPLPIADVRRIPVFTLGISLGLFLALTFAVCVAFDLLFPHLAMYPAWIRFLPGFTWLTWPSFLLGLVETFAYGWYVALVFGPLYNFFATRGSAARRP